MDYNGIPPLADEDPKHNVDIRLYEVVNMRDEQYKRLLEKTREEADNIALQVWWDYHWLACEGVGTSEYHERQFSNCDHLKRGDWIEIIFTIMCERGM